MSCGNNASAAGGGRMCPMGCCLPMAGPSPGHGDLAPLGTGSQLSLAIGHGATLTPSLEAALRHDGGVPRPASASTLGGQHRPASSASPSRRGWGWASTTPDGRPPATGRPPVTTAPHPNMGSGLVWTPGSEFDTLPPHPRRQPWLPMLVVVASEKWGLFVVPLGDTRKM